MKKIFVGFDGFIDTLIQPVRTRKDPNTWSKIETVDEFAKRIQDASGKSANIECVTIGSFMGGNAPLFSLAAAHAGVHIELFGALLQRESSLAIDPLFAPILSLQNISAHPFTQAGKTDAFEFNNGKILFGCMEELQSITIEDLFKKISVDFITKTILNVDAIATLNWTMMPLIDSFWDWLSTLYRNPNHNTPLFVDFADPKKRSVENLKNAFQRLKKLALLDYRVILSVNTSEAQQSLQAISNQEYTLSSSIEKLVTALHKEFPEAYAIIGHSHKQVSASWKEKNRTRQHSLTVQYIDKPFTSTGAGDTFNGAFFAAFLQNIDMTEALHWGVRASRIWVQSRRSVDQSILKTPIDSST